MTWAQAGGTTVREMGLPTGGRSLEEKSTFFQAKVEKTFA